jgi:hypothetical protein
MVILVNFSIGHVAGQNGRARCGLEDLRKSLQVEVLAEIVGGQSLSLVVLIQV